MPLTNLLTLLGSEYTYHISYEVEVDHVYFDFENFALFKLIQAMVH